MDGILDFDNILGESNNNTGDVDDIMNVEIGSLTESEIHGKAPCPPTTGPTKHSGPSAGKIQITSDVYNQALNDLKKTFNESMDLLGRCVVVESANDTISLDDKMAEIYENAIIDAFLEAADNGPLYEAVEKKEKDSIKSIVKKLRSDLPKKLDKSFNFVGGKTALRNIELIAGAMVKSLAQGYALSLGAGLAFGALTGSSDLGKEVMHSIKRVTNAGTAAGGVGDTLGVLLSKYTWNTVGSICVSSKEAKGKLDEIKEIAADYLGDGSNNSLHIIQVNKTFTENIISRFKYNLKDGVLYLLVVDDVAPKELTVLSKPVKKVKVKEEDKKESEKKEEKKESDNEKKSEDTNVNEAYQLVFADDSDITSIDI